MKMLRDGIWYGRLTADIDAPQRTDSLASKKKGAKSAIVASLPLLTIFNGRQNGTLILA
jgi:hypothetical protein